MNNVLMKLRRKNPDSPMFEAMRKERARLIQALISGRPGSRENRFEEPEGVFEQRVGESVDLLIGHAERRPHFDALYAGLRMFELHRPDVSHANNLSAGRASADHDWIVLRDVLAVYLGVEDLRRFEASYQKAVAPLRSEGSQHLRTLIIGDCLMMEIMAFLVGALALRRHLYRHLPYQCT